MDKITVESLNLYYGDFHALKNINLKIPEHKITALRQIDPDEVHQPHERSGRGLPDYRLYQAGRRGNLRRHGCEYPAKAGGYGVSEGQSLPNEHF